MSVQKGNEEIVREEFKKQARSFSGKLLTLNSQVLLDWIHQGLNLNAENRVLDVAAGTGILSRSIAPYVKQVTSLDLSPDMIAEGIVQNQAKKLTNIEYHLAHAEQIPFIEESFDLVISRLAFHHFTNPNEVLREMARVSTFSGTVCVVDMISPEDEEFYHPYNRYERLRDPSHTFALKETEFLILFEETGLELQIVETIEVPVNVQRWLELTKTDEQVAAQITEDIMQEITGMNTITGLFPFIEQGEMMFKQKWIKVLGKKQPV